MSVKVEVGCLYSVTSGFYPDTCCDSFDTITDRSCLFHVSSSQHWYPRLMVTCCSQNECFFVTFMDYFFAGNFKSFHNGANFDVTSNIADSEIKGSLRSLVLVVLLTGCLNHLNLKECLSQTICYRSQRESLRMKYQGLNPLS